MTLPLCPHCPAERSQYMPSIILHDNDCPAVADVHLTSCMAAELGFCGCHLPDVVEVTP